MGGSKSDMTCPYKKRLGHKHAQREDDVRTQEEDSHPQAKKSGPEKETTQVIH